MFGDLVAIAGGRQHVDLVLKFLNGFGLVFGQKIDQIFDRIGDGLAGGPVCRLVLSSVS